MKMFMVGGVVRDEILGVKSKDIDFSVVLDVSDLQDHNGEREPFRAMVENLETMGIKIIRDKNTDIRLVLSTLPPVALLPAIFRCILVVRLTLCWLVKSPVTQMVVVPMLLRLAL
jgi:hypothetical protein